MMQVDSNELQCSIPKILADYLPVTIGPLSSGDYAWYDMASKYHGWERKEISDVLNSLTTHGTDVSRFEDQVSRLPEDYDYCGWIIEGAYDIVHNRINTLVKDLHFNSSNHMASAPYRNTRWNPALLYNSLYRLVYNDIELVFTPSEEATARFLVAAYNTCQKVSIPKPRRRTIRWAEDQQNVVIASFSTAPAIGEQSGIKLYNSGLDSWERVVTASESELKRILGKHKGGRLYNFVRGNV